LNKYLEVLRELYKQPRKLQSDFCRYNAFQIAEAASRGHIASVHGGFAANRWSITQEGLRFLNQAVSGLVGKEVL